LRSAGSLLRFTSVVCSLRQGKNADGRVHINEITSEFDARRHPLVQRAERNVNQACGGVHGIPPVVADHLCEGDRFPKRS
jgi:hypothetical protein